MNKLSVLSVDRGADLNTSSNTLAEKAAKTAPRSIGNITMESCRKDVQEKMALAL